MNYESNGNEANLRKHLLAIFLQIFMVGFQCVAKI
jgi:hypothetical protein